MLDHPRGAVSLRRAGEGAGGTEEMSVKSTKNQQENPMFSERYPEESATAPTQPAREKQDAVAGRSNEMGASRRGTPEQELHLKEFILDKAREAIYLIGPDLRFVYVNDEACRSLDYSREELLAMTPPDIDPDVTREHAQQIHAQLLARGSVTINTRHRRRDGSLFPVEMQGSLFEYQGQMMNVAFVRDITERKRLEDQLAAREREFRSLAENSPDTIARYGRDCRRRYVNPAYAAQAEGSADALLGKTPSERPVYADAQRYEAALAKVFASGKGTEFELKWADRQGWEVCSLIRLTPEFGATGDVATVLAVGRDITELSASRVKIHQMAFYDALTLLPNRALFGDRLRQTITEASRHGQLAGVMMLDLDHFKTVNDTMGHPAGDELLRETAARLGACVRAYDTVARLGGDEFAILLPELRSGDDLGRVATKMLDALSRPFLLDGKQVFVSCSIGIALYPSDSTEADDLLKFADSAMYLAKQSGRNRFRFYSRALTESANERLMLESDLRQALARKELALHYQPKVRLRDGVLIGSEALLRWKHPQRGMVPPDKFISIAEDSGLIVEIGEWVLRQACEAAFAWNGIGKPLHKTAINLSARQFQTGNLVGLVREVLESTGCYPEWIELEITESLLLDEASEVLGMLKAFRSMGISIAIDDFGTGYSALSYLSRFPIDTLKIDRSFIGGIATSSQSAELVKAILTIAHCLGYQVVAEGVETEKQAAFLRAHGCEIAQGYFYGKPMPRPEFECLPLSISG
ncbi:MAG: EAL domain-containing protein [Rhodoferax sp.]|uniref:putative bifunctional diguanylate cyclase/phosphodiesterase n=1 Tax=Rhodoferax sp. TaxID=50421 RepID=UPI0026104416|nr:bifunctional diguanylate cyclase/phosphodiesterase [Rhodoferax sp.]MDD5335132.1 EAL domain-containing protein [Rhodoferax sp.]